MISNRFSNDKNETIKLNKLQKKTKKTIENKIKKGNYKFILTKCPICKSFNFEKLSEKDRYGLFMPVVICKKCGLVQTNPHMTEDSYSNFYQKEYRDLYNPTNSINNLFEDQYQRGKKIFEYLGLKEFKNKNVLEIGCGAGGILKAFKEKGLTIKGFDLDKRYLQFGIKKGLNLNYGKLDDILEKNYAPDIIIYSHVLEHVLDPIKELKKIQKLMHKETLLYIEVPGLKNIASAYNKDFLQYLQNAHTYHFTKQTLKNCANSSGLTQIKSDECIRSIFKKGKKESQAMNDYRLTKKYLLTLESKIIIPLNSLEVEMLAAMIKNKIKKIKNFF